MIDGEVAFTGGVNLADEYINRYERFGHWKDMAVMVKGAAVQTFTVLFLQFWNFDEPVKSCLLYTSWSRGKQPRPPVKVPKCMLSGKGCGDAQTTRRLAQKQPSFKECVTAH